MSDFNKLVGIVSLGRGPDGNGVLLLLIADHDERPSSDGGSARRRRGHGRGLDARPHPALPAAARRNDHPVREMAPHPLGLGGGHVVDGVAQIGRNLDLVRGGNLQRHGSAHHRVIEDQSTR